MGRFDRVRVFEFRSMLEVLSNVIVQIIWNTGSFIAQESLK